MCLVASFALPLLASSQNKDMGSDEIATKKPKTEAQQMMKEARRAAKMQEMSAAMGGSQGPGGKTGIADVPTHQQKDATQTLGHMEK